MERIMSRSSIYESVYGNVYQNISEFKTSNRSLLGRVRDSFTPSYDFMNKSELGSAGFGLASTAATFTPAAPAGVVGELISSGWDIGNAAGRFLQGKNDLALMNLAMAIPYFGTLGAARRLGKAASAAGDISKATDTATAVKGFKQVETPMVTPRPSPRTPSKPRTTPGRKETTKPIEEPDVSTITKDTGVKPGTKLTSGLGKVITTGIPAVSRTSRILSSPVTQGAIAAGAGAALGSGIATSVGDSVGDAISSIPKESLPIPTQVGDPGVYALGSFASTDPSSYAKSIRSGQAQQGERAGYHPFFTMPSEVAMQYRRRNVGLPESVEYNNRDLLYKKAYSAVNRYLRSTEGRQLNNHISDIKKGVAE
jgi:hypothetical protein